ncbi:MMPL family transporter [bacterium]|nr:MMPL family transporter [bacterium]
MKEFVLISLLLLSFPFVAYVSTLPPKTFHNEITEWGDQNSSDYTDFIDYRRKFGANEMVIISWPGCDLNDTRLEEVTKKIETELAGQVQQVSSGQRLYWELRDRGGLSEEAALNRLRNVFLTESGFGTAVGFQIYNSFRDRRGEVIQKLDPILKSSGVNPQEAIFAGLGHNLYMLDKAGLESPFRMVPNIMLLAFLLTIFFVRNLWLALFINALGAYTGCLSFNIIYVANVDMNAIIWPLPTLTMLLTVSASLHFLSYFKKAVEVTNRPTESSKHLRWQYRREVARKSLQFSIKPMLCCTLTTVIGLLSLLLSFSLPVRQFGLFGALSMFSAIALLLVCFPAFLTLIGYAEKYAAKQDEQPELMPQTDRWNSLARFTYRFRWAIVAICVAVSMSCAYGIPKVKTGSNLENFFPAGDPVLLQTAAMEETVGPLASIELLLQFGKVERKNDWLRIRALAALASRIKKQTEIKSCLSAATFAPPLKRKRATGIDRAIENTKLDRVKEEMVKAGLLYIDPETERQTWRVSCRYGLEDSIEMDQVRRQLRSITEELFIRDGKPILAGEQIDVSTTGEFVLFDLVDREFFEQLLLTYISAFGVIMLVVLIVLRNLRLSLIALLPNLFPAVVVLGVAGFLNRSLDVASLMTASVALGIAVDDTLHFLLWNSKRSNSADAEGPEQRHRLIAERMRYCGQAMLQTSVILGASIVLYAFCGFLPTVRFGILLSAMIFVALIGDLLFLPALVACFGEKQTKA